MRLWFGLIHDQKYNNFKMQKKHGTGYLTTTLKYLVLHIMVLFFGRLPAYNLYW